MLGKVRLRPAAVITALSSIFHSAVARADVEVETEAEAAIVAATRNDVRVPGDSGTAFSLVDDFSTSASPAFRIRAGVRIAERHLVTALYAPLTLNATGELDRDLEFEGASFPAGTPLHAVYRFDSYRLTYRYSFVRDASLELAAGATAKIRDAEIAVYGPTKGRKTNTGFVPLLNLHAEWRPGAGKLGLLFDADALAAPQGRAEDVLLALLWSARDGVDLYAGYRTLEGGADNDEVYNFSWLHYGAVGMRVRL